MTKSTPTAQDLKLALRGSPSVVWAQDANLRYIWVFNPSMGKTSDEVVGRTDHELLDRASADRLESMKRQVMAEQDEQTRTVRLVDGDKEEIHEMYLRPVVGEDGRPVGITGVSMQVSEESRILAIEADHRIKNSLALAQALLRAQSRNTSEREAQAALDRAAGDIGAISNLHGKLAEGGSDGTVNLRDYLEEVCSDLAEVLRDQQEIRIETDVADEMIDGGSALKLALIITELITNSVKHGGQGLDPLLVRISYSHTDTGRRLVVEDDGKGLPYDFNAEGDSGIGMRVVQSMSQALGTSPEIDRGGEGARFVFTFQNA
jgi:two-component sensor histidine kinase